MVSLTVKYPFFLRLPFNGYGNLTQDGDFIYGGVDYKWCSGAKIDQIVCGFWQIPPVNRNSRLENKKNDTKERPFFMPQKGPFSGFSRIFENEFGNQFQPHFRKFMILLLLLTRGLHQWFEERSSAGRVYEYPKTNFRKFRTALSLPQHKVFLPCPQIFKMRVKIVFTLIFGNPRPMGP